MSGAEEHAISDQPPPPPPPVADAALKGEEEKAGDTGGHEGSKEDAGQPESPAASATKPTPQPDMSAEEEKPPAAAASSSSSAPKPAASTPPAKTQPPPITPSPASVPRGRSPQKRSARSTGSRASSTGRGGKRSKSVDLAFRPPGTPVMPHRPHEQHPAAVTPGAEFVPGPIYNPDYTCTRSRAPTSKFGTAPRSGSKARKPAQGTGLNSSTPGPIYNLQNCAKPNAPAAQSHAFPKDHRFRDNIKSVSPGPAYEPQFEVTKRRIASSPKFGTGKRGLNLASSATAPGPGAYASEDKYKSTSRCKSPPSYAFPKGERMKPKSNGVPGPVYHTESYETFHYRRSPSPGFTKAPLDAGSGLKLPEAIKVPGPVYNPDIKPTRPTTPSYSIGKAPTQTKPVKYGTDTHPGYVYNVQDATPLVSKGSPSHSFASGRSRDHSRALKRIYVSPGPTYTPQFSQVESRPGSAAFTKAKQRADYEYTVSPGPGAERADIRLTRPTSPSFRFGSSKRGEVKPNGTPGPVYNPQRLDYKSEPSFSFGTSERPKIKGDNTPGPIYSPNPEITKRSLAKSIAFPKEPRDPLKTNEDPKKKEFPGPGAYTVSYSLLESKGPSAVLYTTG